MQPVKVIEAKLARTLIGNALTELGYMKVSSAIGTSYFSKRGTHLKIRVSDHHDRSTNHDVCHDEVVTEPTILTDIQYRAQRAHRAFLATTRRKSA